MFKEIMDGVAHLSQSIILKDGKKVRLSDLEKGDSNIKIGKAIIEEGVQIENDVTIGDLVTIGRNVKIKSGSNIPNGTIIQENSIITKKSKF